MDHLHATTRSIALLPAAERLGHLHTDHWIGYTRARRALSMMQTLLTYQPGRLRPRHMLLVGLSNNGKSTIAEKFRRQHPAYPSAQGDCQILSVVVMQMPVDATVGRFYSAILDALGAPVGHSHKVEQRAALVFKLMRTCQVRMLVIDELHNLLSAASNRQRDLLGLLRYIGNELRIPLVGVGTKDAYLAIRIDDQLENRFQPFVLPRWTDDAELGRLLASFEAVLPLRQPSNLGAPHQRRVVATRGEGLIGEMHQLIVSAAVAGLDDDRERIEPDDLSAWAYEAPSVRKHLMEREVRQRASSHNGHCIQRRSNTRRLQAMCAASPQATA